MTPLKSKPAGSSVTVYTYGSLPPYASGSSSVNGTSTVAVSLPIDGSFGTVSATTVIVNVRLSVKVVSPVLVSVAVHVAVVLPVKAGLPVIVLAVWPSSTSGQAQPAGKRGQRVRSNPSVGPQGLRQGNHDVVPDDGLDVPDALVPKVRAVPARDIDLPRRGP